jgi:hypothetical protein
MVTTTFATRDLALEMGVGIVRLLAKAFGVRRSLLSSSLMNTERYA